MYDTFDPDNVDSKDMSDLADNIELYLDFLEEVMVIPPDVEKEYGEKIRDGIKRSRKLVKKLRKGDRSVFKSADDWN